MNELQRCEYLTSRIEFDPDTGEMIWKPKDESESGASAFNARFANKKAVSKNGNGYLQICFRLSGKDHRQVSHRFAWFVSNGKLPDGFIDHINGNKHDNSIANLRDVTQSENMRNASLRSNNKSGIAGIHFAKARNKWVVQSVDSHGRHVHVGIFRELSDAKNALIEFRTNNGYTERHGN